MLEQEKFDQLQTIWKRWSLLVSFLGQKENCSCESPEAQLIFKIKMDNNNTTEYVCKRTCDLLGDVCFVRETANSALEQMMTHLQIEINELIYEFLANIDEWFPTRTSIREQIISQSLQLWSEL